MILSLFQAGAMCVLAAITPAKVDDVYSNVGAGPGRHAPPIIYVDRFSVEGTQGEKPQSMNRPRLLGSLFGGDGMLARRRAEQQDALLGKLPPLLQASLVEALNKSIAPAVRGDGVDGSPRSWVIEGRFLVISTGSRAMQAGIGFGAGQSDVAVHVRIYTIANSQQPFLIFDSSGASGHMPGAILMHNPYTAAAKFVISKSEPERETKKVAAAIAREIGRFMADQHIPTLAQSSGSRSKHQ